MKTQLIKDAIELLKMLIETPSFSSEEDNTAILIEVWFKKHHIPFNRNNNNVWATNKYFDEGKPSILLNSHHDTVKPNSAYTKDPFEAIVEDGKLYGLGSNDAGGCLVSLMACFAYYYDFKDLKYNLIMVASAEEESSGDNSLRSMLSIIPNPNVAIVGEPTLMQLAVAEKGLVVFDAVLKGTAGHAAHPNNDNVIYKCADVLRWFQDYKFDKHSSMLGETKMTVTQIEAGQQHNAIPSDLKMVIDVRVNDCYTNQEIVDILKKECPCDILEARSLHLNSSSIPIDHPLIIAGVSLGLSTYGSPTLSDQACLSCPSLKMGPGDSTRSHTADEFIYINEIEEGIGIYIDLLEKVVM